MTAGSLVTRMLGSFLKKKGMPAALFALLLIHSALLAWGAYSHSPSIDEVPHLVAGLSHWRFGNFDLYRVNPPLVRMVAALPVLFGDPKTDWHSWPHPFYGRAEFTIGSEFIDANGPESFWLFTIGRWACIPFSLLGGLICYGWSQELYGPRAGILATTLWCFCPNVLAHAQMLTPDVGATTLGVAASYCYWRWLKAPTWFGAFTSGMALGLAELTKSTWIILFGLWPLLWVIWTWGDSSFDRLRARWRQASQMALVLSLGVYMINIGYAFEGCFTKLGDYSFVSDPLGGAQNNSNRQPNHNRFAGSILGSIRVPLPANYVLGIDQQKRDFESAMLSYLRGEWRDRGWWYYYLYGLGIKVPLGTWVLIFLAAYLPVLKIVRSPAWRDELVLLAPVVLILTLVSSQTGFNHHLRYVLPIFPFVFIWVSKVVLVFSWVHWKLAALALTALAWSITSSLVVYPHSLSYFNELVGGPKGGHNHLVDSNIDWGQDLLFLKKWLDKHPEARPLGLAYFGQFDPRVGGIEFTIPPRWPAPEGDKPGQPQGQFGPRPGWYAISVCTLRGLRFGIPDGKGGRVFLDKPYFTYFQRFEPVAMAGYSIYIYHLTLEDANRVRRELGLPQLTTEEAEGQEKS